MYGNEKIFHAERDVKYLFQRSQQKSSDLVVIFSAFPPIGRAPAYNYVRTLEPIECNKLFILDDFGCRATYYLGYHRDHSIESSVMALIQDIITQHNIKRVISAGSSKGGYTALYYGIKYGFQQIIAASPQYLLGEYLLKQTNTGEVAEFIAGGTTEADQQYLNEILPKVIRETKHKPNIFVHVGKGEHHYNVHVKPLLKELEQKGFSYELDLGDYSKHSDVAKHFPKLFQERLFHFTGQPRIKSLVPQTLGKQEVGNRITFMAEVQGDQHQFAWYVYRNGERISVQSYSKNNLFTCTFDKEGKYLVKVFVLNEDRKRATRTTTPIEVK